LNFDPVRTGAAERKGETILRWTLIFVVVALVSGILGFTDIASAASGIARILFFLFLILLVDSLVIGRRSKIWFVPGRLKEPGEAAGPFKWGYPAP